MGRELPAHYVIELPVGGSWGGSWCVRWHLVGEWVSMMRQSAFQLEQHQPKGLKCEESLSGWLSQLPVPRQCRLFQRVLLVL